MPREYTPAIDCTNEQRQSIALQPVTSNQIAAIGYSHDTKRKYSPDAEVAAA